MINSADNIDSAKLHIARTLILVNPRDEYANKKLSEIDAYSFRYDEAQSAWALNLDSISHFELFGQNTTDKINDEIALNRALYHKINNRIAILNEILHERLPEQQDPFLRTLADRVSDLFVGIKERRIRADEKSKTNQFGFHQFDHNYSQTLSFISDSVHNIIDFVGNAISVLQEMLWEARQNLSNDDSRSILYHDLQQHMGRTSDSLNDLKHINEWIPLRSDLVSLRDLFEKWLETDTLRDGNVRIRVKLPEPECSVSIDVQKVQGFVDELIENSINHNRDKENLHILLSAEGCRFRDIWRKNNSNTWTKPIFVYLR